MTLRWTGIALLLFCAASDGGQESDEDVVRVLIAFDSRTGNTESLARAVLEGVRSVEGVEGVSTRQADVDDHAILSSDGLLVGSPVHWANLSVDTKRFLDRVGALLVAEKALGPDSTAAFRTAGAFVTAGSISSGKELARIGILSALVNMKFVVVGAEDGDGFGTLGPQATTGPSDPGLSETELDEARRFGARFASITKRLARAP